MDDALLSPETLSNSSDMVRLILYIGAAIVSGMATAIVALWREKGKAEEYIRQNEKENIMLYNDIVRGFDKLNETVTNVDFLTRETIRPILQDLQRTVNEIKEKVK